MVLKGIFKDKGPLENVVTECAFFNTYYGTDAATYVGSSDFAHFISMPRLPGVPLKQVLSSGRVPDVLLHALEAMLGRLCEAGIMHQDLHDENILVDMTDPRFCYPVDFGSASQHASDASMEKTGIRHADRGDAVLSFKDDCTAIGFGMQDVIQHLPVSIRERTAHQSMRSYLNAATRAWSDADRCNATQPARRHQLGTLTRQGGWRPFGLSITLPATDHDATPATSEARRSA